MEEATGLLGSSSINLKNLVSEVLLSEGKCTLLLSLNLGFVTSLVFKLPLNLVILFKFFFYFFATQSQFAYHTFQFSNHIACILAMNESSTWKLTLKLKQKI